MKDLYDTLGIAPGASPQEIKKAFRALALDAHPDKGGDAERMGLLNEAYQTLSDPERRREFDANWEAYQGADAEQQLTVEFDGYLKAGNAVPYSQTFRAQHQALVMQYEQTPSMKKPIDDHVQPFESGIYSFDEQGITDKQYHDIFNYIRAKTSRCTPSISIPTEPLTPVIAVKLLMDFLSGSYYGQALITLKQQYLMPAIRNIKERTPNLPELLLYEGISDIILMTDERPDELNHLIFSIKKITDFAKTSSDLLLPSIIPLFYNKFFRNLYAYALHLHWNSSEGLFNGVNLNQFDGCQEAKELLDVLKDRLSNGNGNEHLPKLIQSIKLIFNFEKDKREHGTKSQTAADYREAAFHLLDWLPVFIDQYSRQLLANTFLQVGIIFQQASRRETRPAIIMADERLALKMYLTAAELGYKETPDVGIYANTQAIKYISAFQFQDEILIEVLPALKKRTLISTDIFPFFETNQSNVAFLRQGNKTLHLMRHLLTAMVNAHEDGISINHSAVTILYQAYEACIKNWYQEEFDPVVEQKFRLDLMEELLFDNGWTSLDVEQQVDSPWIMVDRDEQGWMRPTRSLPYTDDEAVVKYRTINGAEINHKTGEINFFMTPWTPDRPSYEKVFTLFDLQEMLEKNISGAIFSLDPVDPYKPFHPYNLMRFSPSQLFESELLNTMLLTDYVLKFLTTNQEVQGQYPFEQRPVASMIEHLPEFLRQIINDFHSAQHAGALHRFWIEAEEIDIAEADETETSNLTKISLGNLKMVVKKHRMERDIHGELKDVSNDDEGWPIYVLTAHQMEELKEGFRDIDGHAMIFIYAEQKLYFWEHNQILKSHIPIDYKETLIRLFKQPKNGDGKLDQNTKNMPLLYRATKEMTRQADLSHRYSSEFIFAHEFTTNYDVFAQYLPEFGRLKELSKISVLIRLLSGMHSSNKEAIEALDYVLNPTSQSAPPDTASYKHYNQAYQNICLSIMTSFHNWRRECSSSALQKKWREQLNGLKNEIGTLNFSSYSTEVNEACERWHAEISRDNRNFTSSQIWDHVNPQRSQIAHQLSASKQKNCRSQIYEIYSSHLLSSLGSSDYGRLIDSFMQGHINPLMDALVNYERTKVQNEIKALFPHGSTRNIELALDESGELAGTRVAIEESRRQLREIKVAKDKLETGFTNINLGITDEPVDLAGKCLWVPASVRHEVKKDDTTGLTRYSFFVYGGVNIQPRINVVPGGNGPLGGNCVGGDSFSNVNSQAAMNNKLRSLQKAQNIAVRIEQLDDGRVRYYSAERKSNTHGPTRGNAHVTEHNPKTGQIRAWAESYDHQGNVNRVHPKMVNGQRVFGQHYPPTGAEIRQTRGYK